MLRGMALAAPALVLAEYGQDLTVTVTLSTPTNVSGWTGTATLRAYAGGPALATKTTSSGITVSDSATGVFVISFSAADLTLAPGAYVWEFDRTNPGFAFPIVDPSAFVIRPDSSAAYPSLTNLSEYVSHALRGVTPADADVPQLIQLLSSAEEWIKQYCNRDFAYRALATEYPTPAGTTDILLARTPVDPATVTIYEDWNGNFGQTSGSFDSTTLLTMGTDYTVPIDSRWNDGLNYSGLVRRINTVWPYRRQRPLTLLGYSRDPLPGSVKATYTGGFQLIPYPIKLAVWTLTTIFAQGSPAGRLAMSESGEGESVSYGAMEDIPWTVTKPLAPYRRFVI